MASRFPPWREYQAAASLWDEHGEPIDWWVEHDQGGTPESAERSCTDAACLVILLLAVGLLSGLVVDSKRIGNIQSLFMLKDFRGHQCDHQWNEGKRYLYFCTRPGHPEQLDLSMPRCVEACPNTTEIMSMCHGQPSTWTADALVASYASEEFVGIICRPEGLELRSQVLTWMRNHPRSDLVLKISMLRRAWFVVALAVPLAVVLSYKYLVLLGHFAQTVVNVGLCTMWLLPGLFGCFAFFGAGEGYEELEDVGVPSKFVEVTVLFTVAAFFFCLSVWQGDSIDLATGFLAAGSRCVRNTPALILEPIGSLVLRFFLVFVCLHAALMVVSTVDEVENEKGETHMDFAWYHSARVAYFVFMATLLHDVCWSHSEFAISYTTQLWYFTETSSPSPVAMSAKLAGRGCSALAQAHCRALRYHVGSLAFGALINMLLRPLRAFVSIFGALGQFEDNPVSTLICRCCCCFTNCYRLLQPFNKRAFIDMAMNGRPYCPSAFFTFEVLGDELTTAHIISGATRLFQIAGLGVVACATYVYAWLTLKFLPSYSARASSLFVPNPGYVAAVVAILGFLVAFPFMMTIDGVSYTLLYCYILEKKRITDDETAEYPSTAQFFDILWKPFGTVGEYMGCAASRKVHDAHAHGSARQAPCFERAHQDFQPMGAVADASFSSPSTLSRVDGACEVMSLWDWLFGGVNSTAARQLSLGSQTL